MIHFRTVLLALLTAATAVAQEAEGPMALVGRATAAYDAGRYSEAAALLERVTQLLPRSATAKIRHARALARSGKADAALAQLEAAIAYGVRFDPSDAAWKSLETDSRFMSIASRMRAKSAPLIRSETAFLLEKDLIPENIAYDAKTRSFFVGSMYKAKIMKIDSAGAVTDFVPSRRDGLLSVVGMKVDVARRSLWVVSGNYIDSPPLQIDDPASRGKGAILRFDLDSGKLVQRYDGPGGTPEEPMWFNDLVVAPGGDVYATAGPRGIWRIGSGANAIEPFVSPAGAFFNGITVADDGETLLAASHLDGVMKIDVATKATSIIDVPRGVTLAGIDGLYLHHGSLVAVQNGTDPQRVIRAWLDPAMTRVTRFAVLEQEHPLSDIPLTGTIVGDDLYYVARSQLRAFENGRIWPADRLKETVILRLPLELPAPPPPDPSRDREALLEVHRQEVRAHIERDPKWLADTSAEEFISASNGAISRTTREEMRAFFTKYFDGAVYQQYEDLEPPVIHISDDGSLASVMTRTGVRRTQEGRERAFVYAGIMVYQRRGGEWIRVANASTFE